MTNYNFCHLTQRSGGKAASLRSIKSEMETAKAQFSFLLAPLTVKGDQNLKRDDSMNFDTPPVFSGATRLGVWLDVHRHRRSLCAAALKQYVKKMLACAFSPFQL